MDSAPGIPTDVAQYEYIPDANTQRLNIELNSVEVIDQVPIYRRGNRLATPPIDYNVGYKQLPVDNQVYHMPYHYEAPNVQASLPTNKENIFQSTLVQRQIGDTIVYRKNLRAPGINEGY